MNPKTCLIVCLVLFVAAANAGEIIFTDHYSFFENVFLDENGVVCCKNQRELVYDELFKDSVKHVEIKGYDVSLDTNEPLEVIEISDEKEKYTQHVKKRSLADVRLCKMNQKKKRVCPSYSIVEKKEILKNTNQKILIQTEEIHQKPDSKRIFVHDKGFLSLVKNTVFYNGIPFDSASYCIYDENDIFSESEKTFNCTLKLKTEKMDSAICFVDDSGKKEFEGCVKQKKDGLVIFYETPDVIYEKEIKNEFDKQGRIYVSRQTERRKYSENRDSTVALIDATINVEYGKDGSPLKLKESIEGYQDKLPISQKFIYFINR